MRRYLAVAAIAIAGISRPVAWASPCALALNSQLRLDPPDGLIDARINASPARLMFDTGAFTTVLTAEAAKRLSLRADPDRSLSFRGATDDPWIIAGIGGSRISTEMMADSFELGALAGRRFHFLVTSIKFGAADGLLSTDFLSAFDIDLDFPDEQIRLYRAFGTCGNAKVYLQPPLYAVPLLQTADDKRPLIRVVLDGHSLVALIDTGAQRSAVFRQTAAEHGLPIEPAGSAPERMIHGVGPRATRAVDHSFTSLTVGDLTLRHTHIDIVDGHSEGRVDLLLGADFQRRLHLWISNSAHTLIMQYPPQRSPDLQ